MLHRWDIPFFKLWGHLTSLDLQCHYCSLWIDNTVAHYRSLMIIIMWLELSLVTGKQHWLKLHTHSMQEVPDEYPTVFFNFYGIQKQKRHQGAPVNITRHNILPRLKTLLIGPWRTGNVLHGPMYHIFRSVVNMALCQLFGVP